MEAIFSSKLYRTSTRKQKIAAALNDPINVELVQQLDSYLKNPEEVGDAIDKSDLADEMRTEDMLDESEVDPSDTASENTFEAPHVSSVPRSTPSGQSFESKGEDAPNDSEDTSETKNTQESTSTKDTQEDTTISNDDKEPPANVFHTLQKDNDNKEGEVKESTKIQSATALYQDSEGIPCCDLVRIDAETIKGTLNSREDTAGVSRIVVKDDELWIHYQDSVNLNSIMEPVIYILNASGYTHLEFNRLARSSNAIVFEIFCIPNDVKPITEE